MARLDEGNVYVDPAYTSQEAIDALGGTSSITGEALTYNFNAYADGGTTSNVPAIGGTIYFSNLDRLGSSIYNDGTYDMVLINTRSNYLYAVPKVADKTYTDRDIKVYVEGGTHQHVTLLGRSNNVKLIGNLNFTAKNVHFGDSNDTIGGGEGNDNTGCLILGNITINVSDSTTGGSFYVHCGGVGSVEERSQIKVTINNLQSTSAFRGIRTGGGGDNGANSTSHVYGDFDLRISGSSFNNEIELGYTAVDGSAIWDGNFTMTLSAVTATQIFAYSRNDNVVRPEGTNVFTLNVLAAEKATLTAGRVDRFDVINVASGATLQAATINNASELNIAVGGLVTAGNLVEVAVINVTGDLTEADTAILTGLTVADLEIPIYVNGTEFTKGKFGGNYEIIGGNLVLHNPENITFLVNSNYVDGAETSLGAKGYSTLANAQAAVTAKDKTTIMVSTMDESVDPSDFTAPLVTKDFATVLDGSESARLDLKSQDLVIGDTAADVEATNVSVSYTDYINKVSFGNVTGTASLEINNSGSSDGAIGTIDLTGAVVANAQVNVAGSVIGDVKLADQEGTAGKITIKNSTIANVYGGAAPLTADLTGGNEIENVFAEGYGTKISLAGSHVGTYMAGYSTASTSVDTLTYSDAVTADTLIIGGNANTIGKIDATITGGGAETLKIGGEGDTIGDVDLTIAGGKFSTVSFGDGSISGAIDVTLAGGTTAQRSSGTFYGLIYGASVTGDLDAGSQGSSRTLNVEGNAKVNAVRNFENLNVLGGTLNVAGGGDKSEVSDSNVIEISGNILNRRGINAGKITAAKLVNYGVIGTKRDGDASDSVGIELSGNLENYDYVMTSGMSVANLVNTGKISATSDITVSGNISNSGDLFFKAVSAPDGTFTQKGGLILSGVDFVNTGFVSAGKLIGVNNLTTSQLYVTGGAEIAGNITIDAGAEVAFTNKANPGIDNGLSLGGSITMSDTSSLVVSGNLTTTGTKTITVNVGDLIGSNEIVRAEGGVNDWTIKLQGANAGLYELVQTETSAVIYSVDQLFVNSKFSADSKIVVDGNTLVYGKNAFASVADAVAAARTGAKIVIVGDKTGMDVHALGIDVVLDNSIVGDVHAKNILVSSDSTVNSIVAASGLTIDAGAVLGVTETIPSDLAVKIDASEGIGSRLVLNVDPAKVTLDASKVTVLAPAGKSYYAMVLPGEGEGAPAHAGDLYLISSDYSYFRPNDFEAITEDQPVLDPETGEPVINPETGEPVTQKVVVGYAAKFVDGDTFDAATGDALFANVNAFAERSEAVEKAKAVNGVFVLVTGLTQNAVGEDGVISMIEADRKLGDDGQTRALVGVYDNSGSFYESSEDHTTMIYGSTSTGNVYGLSRMFKMSGDFTFIAKDSISTGSSLYITGNNYGNEMSGDINAEIIGSTFGSTYIGQGHFGLDEDNPIDINLTVKDSRLGAFYGIQMSGSTVTNINANINVNVLDSTVGEHFYVIHTADWVANSGANIYQSGFTAGGITVTMGGSSVTNTLRPGDSLTHGANALQVMNAPTTLHIVATEKSAVTQADWVMEWDTIIIDADATLQLGHNLQFQTAYRGEGNDVLDNAGTPITILVNMSGYEGGTHTVITAGEIYTDANLSSIAVIGDNDLTGQCQLIYSGFRQVDQRWVLSRIGVFDKTDDMYVNTTYGDGTSGTVIDGQELFYGGNAHSNFDLAVQYASEWGGTIIVTGGNFTDDVNFNGSNVELRKGSSLNNISMGGEKASVIDVADGATFVAADGSGKATLNLGSNAAVGAISNFETIAFAADAEIKTATLDLSGTNVVIDVDGFTGSSHIVLTAEGGITGFDASKFTFVGEDADKYSAIQQDNTIVLKSAIQANTYVNTEYTAAITGTILPDGTYLEYGFNAFSTFAEGLAALGGPDNTVTVTGGVFSESFELTDGGNVALADGVSTSGMVIGNGSNTLTVDGNVTIGGVEGIQQITITTGSLLSADYIDLAEGGKIYVTGSATGAKEGNLTKIISTQAGFSGATLTGDPGFYVYGQGNDVYLLDLTRIYLDPTYTSEITGSTAFTGDTLVWGVNAFAVPSNTNLANATEVNNALVTGGTLFVLNWGTNGTQAGDLRVMKDVSVYAQGPTNFSVVFGNNGGDGHVVDGDITITVDNTSTPQGGTAFIHSGNDNARWTFNGNVTVNFIGEGQVNTNTGFAVTKRVRLGEDATLTLNIDGKRIENDVTFFRDVNGTDFNSAKKITINFNNVYGPNDKWIRLLSNNDNTDGSPGGTDFSLKDLEMNITNSWFRADTAQNWSISVVNGDAGSRNTNFTVHLSGATVDGLISGVRNRAQNSPGNGSVYEGTKTVYVDAGYNRLARLIEIHHVVIDANATLVLTDREGSYGNNVPYALHFIESNSSGQDSITIDVSNYNGEDKMLISAPRMGIAQRNLAAGDIELKLTGDTAGKFIAGIGLTHGVYIITKGGDIVYNADITAESNGVAFGNTFINVDEINPDNTNAFADFTEAKAAIATRPNANFFVSGIGSDDTFYADGYKLEVVGGNYANLYGNDDEVGTVASVDLTLSGGTFFNVAVSDGSGTVTGDARIELAGGTYGTPAVWSDPTDPEEEPYIIDPEVPATISGSKDNVAGTSTLVISKDIVADASKADIAGFITDFDSIEIAKGIANFVVTDDVSADSITIDASSLLTVQGNLTATAITIDATTYEGPTRAVMVSQSFESAQPAVTINGDLETYDYRYVEDTLYLVSKNAGNVYLNSTWDASISGTIYNGELLVWGVNAVASMDDALLKLTDDYSLFITGGQFDGTYTYTGKATIDIRDNGATIGGLVLGDGSTITISGVTAGASAIGSIVSIEGYTTGINVTANNETAFGDLADIRSFTFAAGQNITVGSITYRENGGYLNVDFKDYAGEAGTVLQTTGGINNFLQPVEGQTFSRTTVGANNNDAKFMPYYDESTKSVIAVAPGEFAFLDSNASNDVNGNVVTIDGKTTTQVYGYNTSDWNVNSGRYTVTGGTLFSDGGPDTTFYWFFTAEPVNVNIVNLRCGACVAGYNDDNPGHTREGDFTVYAEGCTFTWFTAFAGQGTNASHQTFLVSNHEDPADPESPLVDGVWNLTFKGGTHDTNDFQITNYANISGGTVNVLFQDYLLRGDLQLFHRVYNVNGEGLKEINVAFDNVTAPAAKWCYVWDPRESTNTKIVMSVTNSTFTGDDHTLGFIGNSTEGGWSGEGEFYISGFTMGGRLSGARGRNDQGDISNITGIRTLFVDGENYSRVIRDFSRIDVAKTAGVLRANDINLAETSEIILRGEAGYTGDVKEYIVAGNTISGILRENAFFLDEEGNEIEGYKASISDRTAFIYKTTGDVFLSVDYTAAINGTAIVDADGKTNYLVFGDNAVDSFGAAITSVENRGGSEKAAIQVMNVLSRDFYTRGYRTVVNGGQITTVYGGNAPTTTKVDSGEVDPETGEPIMVDQTVAADAVYTADLTVNAGAAVANVTLATEFSEVSSDATLTVGDGAAFTGTLDGGAEYVGGVSTLSFELDASAKAITGFDNVVLNANGLVELSGTFTGSVITIDASEFDDSTKKVLTAEGGFGDTSAITVNVTDGFGYKFLEDGKTLVITSTLVGDSFANTAWTEADVKDQFVGETALIWGQNAFNSFAAAAAAVGDGRTLTLDGGSSTDNINLTKNNDVIVGPNDEPTAVGSLKTNSGVLSVFNEFSATEITGFSGLNLTAGKTVTVSGGVTLAENSVITVDVTDYKQTPSSVVLVSTENGIANADTATITVEGETDKIFYAYYDDEDKDIHLMRIDNFYVDTAYGEHGENIQPGQTNPITGERLIWGVNTFYYLTDGLNAMKPGQCLYINGRTSNISTGDRMGNIYLSNSTCPVVINGYTTGEQVYYGDVWFTVENSTIATENGSYLIGNVTMGEPWNHNQHIIGNMTVNVIGSTIGGDTGAILISGMNFVNILGTETEMATITFNFVDTIIRDDFAFLGDSPIGKDETYQGVTRKGANVVINFDNVLVPQAKWWRIMDGDQQSEGTVTVSIKGSTIGDNGGENMRFSLGSWQWGDPRNHCDFIFTVEDSVINGYLQSSKHDDGNHGELINFDGNKSITLKGDNTILRTYWFDEINLTAGATLTGNGIRMASKGGTINVDVTGYTGKSKVLVSMRDAFENVSAINVTGAEGTDYTVMTSDRAIVIKGAVKDLYVNSTYTAETCPAGTVYNDELLFFGENAFATITEAAPALTEGAVLYVTGATNSLETAALTNSLTIDATATLNYSGSDAITIAGDLVNAGSIFISAAGFVDGSQIDVTVLSATSITGEGTFKTDDNRYTINTIGNEVHLNLKKADVFVSTEWADAEVYPVGTVVDIPGGTAVIGTDAFATADAAVSAVSANGSITILAGDVSFTQAITSTAIAKSGVTIQKAAIGTGSANGSLTLDTGAIATNVSVRAKGALTVNAGATVTGGLGMITGADVTFAEGSVLDFDISGTTSGASATVTNYSLLKGAPNYTITITAGQADGVYALATDAASFNSNVTLQTSSATIGELAFGVETNIDGILYTVALDGTTLTLTKQVYVAPIEVTLVNSAWAGTEPGTVVVDGGTFGYNAFATGDEAIAAVISYGQVKVLGGTVSFTDAVTKTVTVNDEATLVGKATFGTDVTINGTVAFDTAFATAEAAQIGGFSFISGTTKYTLNAAAVAGTYLLATDVTAFTSSVQFGDVTLTVGAEPVIVGGFEYALTLDEGKLALAVAEYIPPVVVPTLTYANSDWTGKTDGTIVNVGTKTAKIGYDAFATLEAAEAAVSEDGSVEVTGGEITFGAYTKPITVDAAAKVVGKNVFDKAITINGTVAFDTAFAAADVAQFSGYSFVSGDATYTLTDATPSAGTYLLVSEANAFTSTVAFGDTVLTVGAEATVVGGYTYALSFADSKLTLTVEEYVPPVVVPTLAYVNSEWAGKEAGTTVTFGDKTATIGYDAFAALADAEAAVTVDGSVEVAGGVISFVEGYTKPIVVDAAAKVVGTATFDKAITVNGEIAFDIANATAEAAQFGGFSFVGGAPSYTLTVATPAAGTYLLASEVTAFTSNIAYGTNLLVVGAPAVLIGSYTYGLTLSDGKLALTIDEYVPPTPTYDLVYVNSDWTGLEDGTTVTVGDKTATIGADAFASGDLGIANVTETGTVEVVGGTVTFNNPVVKTVTVDAGAKLVGQNAFAASITVNGEIVFDTSFSGSAISQFSGFSYVGGAPSYTLYDTVLTAGSYVLASEVTAFTDGITFGDTTLTVGAEATQVGDFTYALSLSEGSLTLTVAAAEPGPGPGPEPTPLTQAYVNSAWAGTAEGTVVVEGITYGYNGFAALGDAEAAVTDDGKVNVVGGEITFGAYTKTITVDADATVVGKNVFDKAITINGTVAFDTAIATATAAQVTGLSFVSGNTTYTVTAAAAAGTYLLASDASGFNSAVKLGDATLTVNGDAVTVGSFSYALGITGNSELALTVTEAGPGPEPTPLTQAYVNSDWAGVAPGTVIGGATIGYDGFATLGEAEAAVTTDGKVDVVGGEITFGAYTKTITVGADAKVVGKNVFDKAITINGTVAFDTAFATATAAQVTGLSFVSGTAVYTLTDATPAAGTYLLASDASGFNSDVLFGLYTLSVGDEATLIGDFTYALNITDNNELALVVTEYVPPVVIPTQAYVNSEWSGLVDGDVVTVSGGTAIIGYDAFATLAPAIAGVTEDGQINVVGGTVSFKDGYSKTITVEAGATVVDKATFNAPITINGTVAFDLALATATEAQFNGFSFVSGDATFTLTGEATKGTYLLATDAAGFDSPVQYGAVTLVVGAEEPVTIGDYNYALDVSAAGELALFVSELVNGPDDGWNNYVYDKKAGFNPNLDDFVVNNLVPGVEEVFLDERFSVSMDGKHNFVNGAKATMADTADYAVINLDSAASLVFKADALAATKLSIYRLVESKGKFSMKKLQSTALKKDKATGLYAITTKNLLLEAGTYYIAVDCTDKKATADLYNVYVDNGASTFFVNGDDGWNNYVYDKKATPAKNPNIDDFVENKLVKNATNDIIIEGTGTEYLQLDNPVVDVEGWSNFVGFGDAADYAVVKLEHATSLALSANALDASKLVIYSFDGVSKLKALQTTTLKKAKGATEYSANTKNLLLEAGTYFVSVQSTNAKKGGNAYYNVKLNDATTVYDDGDNGWNNYVYDKKANPPKNPNIDEFVENFINGGTTEVLLDADHTSMEDWSNFVGFGDTADYAKIIVEGNSVKLSFSVTSTDAAKFIIYSYDGATKMKALQTTTLKKAKGSTVYTADTKALALANGEYFISVQSTNAKKGGAAYYNVAVNQNLSTGLLEVSSALSNDAVADIDNLFVNQSVDTFADVAAYNADSQLIDDKQSWQSIAALA